METVKGRVRAGALFSNDVRAEKRIGKRVSAEIPRAEEVVFRAGTVDGRRFFAVNEKHVVAFSPPVIMILKNGHGDAGELAAASGFHPDVVVFAGEVRAFVHFRIAVVLPVAGPA